MEDTAKEIAEEIENKDMSLDEVRNQREESNALGVLVKFIALLFVG